VSSSDDEDEDDALAYFARLADEWNLITL
jgi:hypothetical protein